MAAEAPSRCFRRSRHSPRSISRSKRSGESGLDVLTRVAIFDRDGEYLPSLKSVCALAYVGLESAGSAARREGAVRETTAQKKRRRRLTSAPAKEPKYRSHPPGRLLDLRPT